MYVNKVIVILNYNFINKNLVFRTRRCYLLIKVPKMISSVDLFYDDEEKEACRDLSVMRKKIRDSNNPLELCNQE